MNSSNEVTPVKSIAGSFVSHIAPPTLMSLLDVSPVQTLRSLLLLTSFCRVDASIFERSKVPKVVFCAEVRFLRFANVMDVWDKSTLLISRQDKASEDVKSQELTLPSAANISEFTVFKLAIWVLLVPVTDTGIALLSCLSRASMNPEPTKSSVPSNLKTRGLAE